MPTGPGSSRPYFRPADGCCRWRWLHCSPAAPSDPILRRRWLRRVRLSAVGNRSRTSRGPRSATRSAWPAHRRRLVDPVPLARRSTGWSRTLIAGNRTPGGGPVVPGEAVQQATAAGGRFFPRPISRPAGRSRTGQSRRLRRSRSPIRSSISIRSVPPSATRSTSSARRAARSKRPTRWPRAKDTSWMPPI